LSEATFSNKMPRSSQYYLWVVSSVGRALDF
jgi:hypothetical protein